MPKYNKFTIFDAYPESEKQKMLDLIRITKEKYEQCQPKESGSLKAEAGKQNREKPKDGKLPLQKHTEAARRTVPTETPINQTNLF